MDYPLFIHGSEAGCVRFRREGLYTVLEAECFQRCEGLVRLWLHGGGESCYLGIMQPQGEGMLLRKKYSRHELLSLPQTIQYASDEEVLHSTRSTAPEPEPAQEREEDCLWFRGRGGSLIAQDSGGLLIAIPEELRSTRPGLKLRTIEGKKYIIFRY